MNFEDCLKWYHRITVDDVIVSDVKGYWKIKELCPGGSNCRHATRAVGITCNGAVRHMEGKTNNFNFKIFQIPRDEQGRFTWEKIQ